MKLKIYAAAALTAAVLTLSGCGGNTIDDEFVFGKNRISCANETVTVTVPFEMGVSGTLADLAPKDTPKVYAKGNNRYMQVIVMGEASDTKTVETEAEAAEARLRGSKSVSEIKAVSEDVTVAGAAGKKLSISLIDTTNGKKTPLTMTEYIFRQNKTIWQVIYQYRTGDRLGEALSARVAGGIEKGATF